MQASEIITVKLGPATVQLPADLVVRNLLDSLSRTTTKPSGQPPRIGEFWPEQGGVYAGLMRGENGQPNYHLIVPTNADASIEKVTWGSRGEEESGATSDYDGFANTHALYLSKNDHPAAQWAYVLSCEGHDDWYLPARRELALCYANVPELFEQRWHWSSTQYSAYGAWVQDFDDGDQYYYGKNDEFRARAVRRFISPSVI